MNHYTLLFPDEETARAAAASLGYLDDDGEPLPLGHKGAMDVIGDAMVPATYGADGSELSPSAVLPGFYVNLALPDLPDRLVCYTVNYGSGGRIFAGTEIEPGAWPPKPPSPSTASSP